MKNICIIGAGNIGSRHLQALKKVKIPLCVTIIDPSLDSLQTANERYEQIPDSVNHQVKFIQDINEIPNKIDIAIIATNSNIRRKVVEDLLAVSSVKYLILEKILFQKKEDYTAVEKLLEKKGCKTWIDFSMRTNPFYYNLQKKFGKNGPIQFIVTGGQFGLITNAIHYVDYIAFLTGCYDFKTETRSLDPKVINSKRPGFLELNGTLNVHFKDGSSGSFTCYPEGNAPYLMELSSKNFHCISKENEGKVWVSSAQDKWSWKEVDSNLLYQSGMTNLVVEKIIKTGLCDLTPYAEASKLHLQLLEDLLDFLNKNNKDKYKIYPFT